MTTTQTAATPEAPPPEAGKRLGKRLALAELDALFGDRLSYRERMAGGPPWACWELVATAEAREKLTAWLATDPPRPWESPPREVIGNALWGAFFGDDVLRRVTARVLASLPLPVVQYTLDRVTFLGVGAQLRGWAGAPPALDVSKPWLVALGAWATIDTSAPALAAHEISHTWLLREPTAPLVDSFEASTVRDTEIADVKPEHRPALLQWRRGYDRREREADALMAAWGFSWPQNSPLSTERRMLRW